MKTIVHVCLTGPYTDGLTYQENLLAKYHVKIGYDVFILASQYQWGKNNNLEKNGTLKYTNQNGVNIIRLPLLYGTINTRLKWYIGLYKQLKELRPDILFIHGCQFLNMFTIVHYLKKHSNIKVYVDNHADFSNSATNWLSKNILHKFIWRICAKVIEPYTIKFYGVLPARVDFLKNVYKLPVEKCELLVMGADDELVEKSNRSEVRTQIRKKYNIADDDFLIVTGGKIDKSKKQTLLLMQAIKQIENSKLKLIVFGSVIKELQSQILQLADGEKIQYIGWINSQDSYSYFSAADLVCFPGRHSVFWEQVVGQGIPLVVKDWEGTHHIDVGGNVVFLKQDSVEEIQKIIERIIYKPIAYNKMKKIAEKKGLQIFSYKEIAKRSVEE